MTEFFKTTLLGKEFPQATVPHDNIQGTLCFERMGLAFYPTDSQEAIWAVAFPNITKYGWDFGQWQYDSVHKITGTLGTLMTFGLFNANQHLYLYIVYYEEQLGHNAEVWFLVSDGHRDEEKGNRLVHQLGSEIATFRERLRRVNTPR